MNLYDNVKKMRDEEGLSWNVIAQKIRNIREFDNGENLRMWFRRERSRLNMENPELDRKIYTNSNPPVALPKPFDDVLILELQKNQRALILADIHVPYHSEKFIESALKIEPAYGAIIVAGDLFTFDQISKYSKAHNMPRMETELEIGGSMLLYLAEHAPVYITNSNHDARFANKIDVQFSLKRLMNAALNGRKPKHPIITTERDYMFVNGDFIVGHLNSASGLAGKIAHGIAQKYQRHCLAGHDHITGVYNSRSRYIGASIGCAADYEKFWYAEKGMNPTKFMQRGFAIIDGDSNIELFNESNLRYFHRWYTPVAYHTCITEEI